jgi:hypothetical protein
VTDAQSHITLFNDERYQRCNLRPGQRLFRYDHVVDGRLIGTLSGVVEDGQLDCGHSAPFGGVDCVRRGEFTGVVRQLLRTACSHARAEGIREIRIRARPAYFGANETAAEFALFNAGASIESCELSLGLEPRRYRAPEQYAAALKSSAARALRQGLVAGMAFGPAQTATDWATCFELLVQTRRRRGARLKISLEYVMMLRKLFGGRIAMHRLMQGGELAGAALVYRVARDWDYVVAWGDDLRYRTHRVINIMAYHLMCAAIAQRVTVIDLGISSVGGVPDDGLIQFKRNINAATGLRINFRLPLE